MQKRNAPSAPSAAEGEIEHVPALVPPGAYRVRFSHWWTALMFGKQGKLALVFKVCDIGPHFEAEIPRWYNVKLRGKAGRNGGFKVGWRSALLADYVKLIGLPNRNDRIALTRYSDLLLAVEVETVSQGSKQEALPKSLHYSVIRELTAIEAGRKAA